MKRKEKSWLVGGVEDGRVDYRGRCELFKPAPLSKRYKTHTQVTAMKGSGVSVLHCGTETDSSPPPTVLLSGLFSQNFNFFQGPRVLWIFAACSTSQC